MLPKLQLSGVGMTYNTPEGETIALRNITFAVAPSEFVSIVGPSGCGKSTLLSLIGGLIRPTEGHIFLDGAPILGPARRIGYMLQNDYLFGWRTVLDNCLLGLEIRRERTPDRIAEVKELLDAMGLAGFERHYPHQLSGGMRQRAALVRTLALNPDVLLLDEPFGALDYQTRLHLEGEVADFLRSQKKSAILVTHDIAEAVSMSDRVIVLSRRPAEIRAIFDITLSSQSRSPLDVRNAPEFNPLFQAIWSKLDHIGDEIAARSVQQA